MTVKHSVSLSGFAEYHDGSRMLTSATIVSSLEKKKRWYKCINRNNLKYGNYTNAYEDCKNSNSSIQTYFSKKAMIKLLMDKKFRQHSKRNLLETWGNATLIFPNAAWSSLLVEAFIWTGTTRSGPTELIDESGEIFSQSDFLKKFGCDEFTTGDTFPISVELTKKFSLKTFTVETRKGLSLY